jgi:hypothetical protein
VAAAVGMDPVTELSHRGAHARKIHRQTDRGSGLAAVGGRQHGPGSNPAGVPFALRCSLLGHLPGWSPLAASPEKEVVIGFDDSV